MRKAVFSSAKGLYKKDEINPYVVSRSEFVKRRNEGDHFISKIIDSDKIFLKGSEHELATMEI